MQNIQMKFDDVLRLVNRGFKLSVNGLTANNSLLDRHCDCRSF
jgi:hypothetical protein